MRACGIVCLVVGAAVSVAGCSQHAEPLSNGADPLEFAASFQKDGVTWTKVPEMTEADVRQLSEYFRRNPSVAENSLVAGDPVVYAAEPKGRRFYWSAATIEGVEWLCIEIGRGPVRMIDGRGDPFGDAAGHAEGS
ncbi:hypothetical protein [Maioricimonas rarisocia]|uniref:hypothetical protein n=1 Tax=Maioricimonas rarisocia TaxID=2528026 RepID=UPI0018D241A9|nr:hypothetical protein [Maioricimonas rarisocia]